MTWYDPDRARPVVRGACVLHAGPVSADGYGRVHRRGQTLEAHRVAYEQAKGAIPKGQVVRHLCNVRRCINPEHLVLGTPAQNANDRARAGRTRNQHGAQAPSRDRRW